MSHPKRRAERQPPKNKKKPDGRQATGRCCNLGHIYGLADALLEAPSADLNRCDHAKNPRLSQRCHARFVITELPAQDLLCMLA